MSNKERRFSGPYHQSAHSKMTTPREDMSKKYVINSEDVVKEEAINESSNNISAYKAPTQRRQSDEYEW